MSEKKIIKNLREWIGKTFSKHPVLSQKYVTKLKNVPEAGERNAAGYFNDFDL